MYSKKVPKSETWHTYFIHVASVIKERSDCLTRSVGAVIVKDHRIVATGYNGAPHGLKNCNKGGCKRCTGRMKGTIKEGEKLDECICVHGEENAITQAANQGISLQNATIYVTHLPCLFCTKLIIQSGITKVYFLQTYPGKTVMSTLKKAGIKTVQIHSSEK